MQLCTVAASSALAPGEEVKYVEGIISSIIVGSLSLIGVIVTGIMTSKKSETVSRINQAITDTKIEELTREVREHNNYARRVPVLEEQMRIANHRISNLEKEEETK